MKHLAPIVLLAATLLPAGAVHAEDALPAFRAQVAGDVAFPDPARATRPQGAFVPAVNVALITPGMKKSQVYTLLDVPHFSEGLFGVRRWNYLLNFYSGRGDEYRQCQYQIRYDAKARVEAVYWREQACADAFAQALAVPAAVERVVTKYVETPAPAVSAAPERALKTYSFTFDFNKTEISPEGRRVIDQVVQEASGTSYRRIVVTGFTDTVGSQPFNDGLAAQRAARTVSELVTGLRRKGSPLAAQTFARGGRDLAVTTADEVREEQNRRVAIELF